MTTTFKGLDLSKYQGSKVDFVKVAKAGYQFVILKATEGGLHGSNIVDPMFAVNFANATKAGLAVHAYHYFLGTSNSDAIDEADLFIKTLKSVKFTGYAFVDVEDKSLSTNSSNLTSYVNTFLNHMEAYGYKKLGIYSGKYFYTSRLIASKLKSGILTWIASYNNSGAGVKCHVWQHSSNSKVDGVQGVCDENIAYTDALCLPKVIKTPPKPVTPTQSKPITKPSPSPITTVQKIVTESLSHSFTDVPSGFWAENEINDLVKRGILIGNKDGTLKPNDALTSSQFAVILANLIKNGYLNDPTTKK